MPIITCASISPVTISALDSVVDSSQTAEIISPVFIYALPALVLGPPPAAPTSSPVPDGLHARVLNSAGVFICHLPHTDGLRWLDEHNSAGSGSIDYRRYDDLETAHPGVWAAGNQIVITVGTRDIFRIILDAEPSYRIDETGQRIDTWAGTGALGVINSGMIEPEYGFRLEATEERSFDYGSNPSIGGWVVPSEWHRPVGKPVRKSWRWTHKKRHLPKGWPDRKSQWIWWKSPDAPGVPDEICYFRSSFTLLRAARVKFWVCGDDTLEFQVDGEIRATTGPGGWKKPTKIVLQLSAGVHYVAAKVQNSPATDGNSNRSGFLCAIARVQSDGDVIAYVRRSNPTHWVVRRQMSGPPGWFAAQIARQLIVEAGARGCAGHAGITLGFSTTTDSNGAAWVSRNDMGLIVGTQGLEWMQRLVETGIDVFMTPALRLNLYRRRGVNRASTVRLDQGTGHAMDESAAPLPGIRNIAYAKANSGWVGLGSTPSIAASGRRETVVSLGSSRSRSRSLAALTSMLPDLAEPPQTIEVILSGAVGPQPHRDFDVADWVSYRPAGATTWGSVRVMSISGEATDTGFPKWTVQLYKT